MKTEKELNQKFMEEYGFTYEEFNTSQDYDEFKKKYCLSDEEFMKIIEMGFEVLNHKLSENFGFAIDVNGLKIELEQFNNAEPIFVNDKKIINMKPDETGDKYEAIVYNELIKYNPNVVYNKVERGSGEYQESISWYDFEDFGGIEVKGDEIADNSNKYAFDKHTNGKPSGLNTTKAKWHILFTSTRYFIINTDILQWLCKYNGEFRYWHEEANRFINVAILHDEKFYNKDSDNIMDLYRIPLPAIQMFSVDSGKIEDFNLKSIL